MSHLLNIGILQQARNGGGAAPSGLLLDDYPNPAMAYSLLRLGNSVNNSVRASNSLSSEQDIALGSSEINNSALEAFANGALATGALWIDQSGNYVNLPQAIKTIQPNLTDSSGNALGYIDTINLYGASSKYFMTNETSGLPSTSGDYVVSFVFKNNTSTTTDSAVFCIKNSDANLIGCNVRRSGGNYKIDVIRNATLNPTIGCTVARGLTAWVLITVRVVGGVITLYVDGVAQTTSTGSTIDVRGSAGVWTTCRAIVPTTQPRLLHMKTLIMYTGADLSAFDIGGFNTKMKEIHGIS